MLNRKVVKPEGIENYAFRLNHEYTINNPYPHVVIDNEIDPQIIESVINEFPDLSKIESATENSDRRSERKFSSGRGSKLFGSATDKLMKYLNSGEFLDFLQIVTGINESLIQDPHFIGGGLH